MMLEEALRIDTKNNGSTSTSSFDETAAATMMLSFIQSELLPAGGATSSSAAEQRFFHVYGPLIERIFGKLQVPIQSKDGISTSATTTKTTTTTTTTTTISSQQSMEDDDDYHHLDGGWLSVDAPWKSMTSYSSTSSGGQMPISPGPRPKTSLDNDPIVKLLGGALRTQNPRHTFGMNTQVEMLIPTPTLIEAISKESESRSNAVFSFPFHGLPKAIQETWLGLIRSEMAGSQVQSPSHQPSRIATKAPIMLPTANDIRLFGALLRNGPLEQRELMIHIQRQGESAQKGIYGGQDYSTFGLNGRQPFHSMSPSNGRSHDLMSNNRSNTSDEEKRLYPSIRFDMLEYYLLLFIRFPLSSAQPIFRSASSDARNIPGARIYRSKMSPGMRQQETYGETLYYHIFRRYLKLFLPYDSLNVTSPTTSSSLPQGEGNNNRNISFMINTFPFINETSITTPVRVNVQSPPLRESELFLRLIITLWLESPYRVLTTDLVVNAIRERRKKTVGFNSPSAAATSRHDQDDFDLDSSYDLAQLQRAYKYDIPTIQVRRCLRILVIHAIMDPSVRNITEAVQRRINTNEYINHNENPNITLPIKTSYWSMTSCMTALQVPVYNFIRTSFRYSSIHESDSAFQTALNIWLLWLEPWNVIQAKRSQHQNTASRIMDAVGKNVVVSRTIKIPREKEHNLFDKDPLTWEPYVAANLYMYVIPLAIFLRRAREFDFSIGRSDRSIVMIRRVFRIFSPPLVQVLKRCLDMENLHRYSDVVRLHEKNLGSFGPPKGMSLFLSSYRNDMQSLLEEINTQHNKKVRELSVFDRMVGWIEGWFGAGVVSGEEKILDSLIERAKLIADLPLDYEFLPSSSSKKGPNGAQSMNSTAETMLRNPDGTLTDYGRQQILNGQYICSGDFILRGDPMKAKVSSYEISFLVTTTVFISKYINDQLKMRYGQKNGSTSDVDDDVFRNIILRFRINLRFLADYRNLFLMFIFMFLIFIIRLFL